MVNLSPIPSFKLSSSFVLTNKLLDWEYGVSCVRVQFSMSVGKVQTPCV